MPFPVFKDFDKDTADLISDDFDSKISLKIKSAGPAGTTITTNTQYVDKDGKQTLKPKVSLKWPHCSGFTLEKYELSSDCKYTFETSLKGAAPGLKLDFKADELGKADLCFEYAIPAATFSGEVDVHNLSKAETAISAGHGPISGGVSAKFSSSKDESNKMSTKITVGLGLGYTIPDTLFAAVRAKDNFSAYSALASYTKVKDFTFAGSFDYSAKSMVGVFLSSYKVDPTTTFKAKASTEGIFSASLKKNFEKKFSVIGSLEVPSNMKSMKWGVNATLG